MKQMNTTQSIRDKEDYKQALITPCFMNKNKEIKIKRSNNEDTLNLKGNQQINLINTVAIIINYGNEKV